MDVMAFHVDGTEWTGRAQVFTLATADTLLHIYHRDAKQVVHITPVQPIPFSIIPLSVLRVLLDILVEWHHLDSLCRTMSSTVSTSLFFCNRQTILLNPYSMTYLNSSLFFLRDRLDGTCWTDICTTCTFWSAVTILVTHRRLEELSYISRGPQHFVGTVGNTELTGCAMLLQVGCRQGTRRRERRLTCGRLPFFNHSQTSIGGLLLRFQGSSRHSWRLRSASLVCSLRW